MDKKRDSIVDLMRVQLNEIYFTENQLLTSLEMNARVASDEELIEVFRSHRGETVQHVHRVEAMFKELGLVPGLFPSQAIMGQLDDGKWMMSKFKGDPLLDVSLIISAQKVENFEISCYQAILTVARNLQVERIISSCEVILEEEKDAKRKLRGILSRLIGEEHAMDRQNGSDDPPEAKGSR